VKDQGDTPAGSEAGAIGWWFLQVSSMPDYIAKLRLLRNATAAVRSRRARPATVIGDAVQGWRLGFEAGGNWAERRP
jgi:hypothetical protein